MNNFPLQQYMTKASPLVFGCMGLGGGWNNNPISKADIAQVHQVVDAALEAGILIFDHADIYTFGKAEQAFGEAMAQRPALRQQIYLQSKCGIRFADQQGPKRYDFSADWIASSVDGILSRLGVDNIDLLMLHRPDPLMQLDELAAVVNKIIASGKVTHIGVSNMQLHQIAYLQSAIDTPIVANQIEISLQKLDWIEEGVCNGNAAGQAFNFTPGTMEYCRLNQIQIQAWGSLCQGWFSGRHTDGQPEHIRHTAHLVGQLATEYQTSPEAIVLAWLMRHPANIQPVIGTTNPDRIKACGQAPNIQLTREQWYRLYASARGNELP